MVITARRRRFGLVSDPLGPRSGGGATSGRPVLVELVLGRPVPTTSPVTLLGFEDSGDLFRLVRLLRHDHSGHASAHLRRLGAEEEFVSGLENFLVSFFIKIHVCDLTPHSDRKLYAE